MTSMRVPVLFGIFVVLLALGGVGAWYYLRRTPPAEEREGVASAAPSAVVVESGLRAESATLPGSLPTEAGGPESTATMFPAGGSRRLTVPEASLPPALSAPAAGTTAVGTSTGAQPASRLPMLPTPPAAVEQVAPVPGTIRWQAATALNWVNIRSDARLDASVVGMLTPNQGVEMGDVMRGWRRVRVGAVQGWVDASFLAAKR
ncbi:MAG: hypothetical protein ABIZ91_10935 [Gemmatimonadaceae bacterium]